VTELRHCKGSDPAALGCVHAEIGLSFSPLCDFASSAAIPSTSPTDSSVWKAWHAWSLPSIARKTTLSAERHDPAMSTKRKVGLLLRITISPRKRATASPHSRHTATTSADSAISAAITELLKTTESSADTVNGEPEMCAPLTRTASMKAELSAGAA
jgi:hypothetical protein